MAESIRLSPESYEKLKKRLQDERDHLDDVVKEIEEARKQGDLSENADYSAAMDEQKATLSRISELQYQVDHAEVVSDLNVDTSKVSMNSKVTILRLDRNIEKVYVIGDSISTDPDHGIISESSPIGRALSGHHVGEIVRVESAKPYEAKIIKIEAAR